MTDQDYDELVKLIGEEQAAPFRDAIRQTNTDIDDNDRIARQQAEDVEAEVVEDVEEEVVEEEAEEEVIEEAQEVVDPEADEVETEDEITLETPATTVVELDVEDQEFMRSLADAAVSGEAFGETVASLVREVTDPLLQARDERIAELTGTVETLTAELDKRVGELERDDDKKQADWLANIPVRQVFAKGQTHRKRDEQPENGEEDTVESYATVAEKTLTAWDKLG